MDGSHFNHWLINQDKIDDLILWSYKSTINNNLDIQCHINKQSIETNESLNNQNDIDIINQYKFLIEYYCRLMQLTCGIISYDIDSNDSIAAPLINMRWRTIATAIEFFKRFYLNNSMIGYDPRIIMLSSYFLAGKVEHTYIKLADILKIYDKCNEKVILDHEEFILKGLGYELKIYHPLNCNHTLISDFKLYSQQYNTTTDLSIQKKYQSSMAQLQNKSNSYINTIQISLISLIFTPLSIAISSLLYLDSLNEYELPVTITSYLNDRFPQHLVDVFLSDHNNINNEYNRLIQPFDNNTIKSYMNNLKKIKLWKKESKKRNRDDS